VATYSSSKVRIDRGHLFVGDDTYPLQNVAKTSVQSWTLYPAPTPGWATTLTIVGLLFGVPTLFSTIAALASSDSGFWIGTNIFWLIVWGSLATAGIWRLTRPKAPPLPLAQLEITTSGAPYAAIWSDNHDAVVELRNQITLAINDLGVTYQSTLNLYQVDKGDVINQNASNTVGKVDGGGTGIRNGQGAN
jgi:hypothetical protein